jgi:hypothetical protein
MATGPRRVVADVLLMSARQIRNPIALLIQMVIDDLARSALRLRVQYATCEYCTLFPHGVPECMQKPGWRVHVPFVTDCWEEKKEDGLALKNEVANGGFMVGGRTERRGGKRLSCFAAPERGCRQHFFDTRTL